MSARARARFALAAAFVALLASGSGCAYFNTFYHARGHFAEAEKARLETAGEPKPPSGGPASAAGEAGERVSKRALDLYDKCMKKCAKVLTDYQNSRWVDDALLLMGKCAIARGEYATGLRKYEELLEFYPNSDLVADARLQIGVAHLEEGVAAQAIPALEAAIADSKREDLALDAHYYLGRARLAAGDSAAAVAEFGTFIAGADKHPLRKTAIRTLGAIEFARGNPAKAREVYERLDSSPRADWKGYREAQLAIAECLREEGRLDESRKVYESLLTRATDVRDSAEVALDLALIVKKTGDDTLTVAAFEDVALRYPRTEAAARSQYEKGVIFYDRDADLARSRGALDSVAVHSGQIPQAPLAKERARVLARRLALDDRLATRLQRVAAAAQEPEPTIDPAVVLADSPAVVPADSARIGAGAALGDSSGSIPAATPADTSSSEASGNAEPETSKAARGRADRAPADNANAPPPDTTGLGVPPNPLPPAARVETPGAAAPTDTSSMSAFLERARVTRDARAAAAPPAESADGLLDDQTDAAAEFAEGAPAALGDSASLAADSAAANAAPAISSTQYLATLSPDSLASLVALADSAGREDLAAIYVEIGEVELLDLRRVEEALAAYETVVKWFPDSPQEPRALLATAWIRANRLGRPEDADSLYWRILSEYGETEFARGAALALGMDVPLPELDGDSLVAAALVWPAAGSSALARAEGQGVARKPDADLDPAVAPDSLTPPAGFENPTASLFPGDSVSAAVRGPDGSANPMDLLAPRVLTLAEPFYTDEMRELGLRGTVRVEVTVGLSGNATDAQVLESENAELDGAAIEAALRSTFTPPRGSDFRATVTFKFPPGDTTGVGQ